jgi:membrane associated rhomboid family serine protease
VINALVLAGLNNGAIEPEGLYLEYGNGLHPLQWLTSNFLHGGVLHLVGNMVFLWVFGVLIEGKIGWWFGPLYLGIGILESAAEQAMMLGVVDVEGSLGASSILYGLLAIAAVWAPKNEVSVFFLFWMHVKTFHVTIRTFCWLYVLWDCGWATIGLLHGNIGSAFLHVLGAAVGLPIGIVLVKRGLVDCEGWDIFSLKNREPKLYREPEIENDVATESEQSALDPREIALELIEDCLAQDDVEMAQFVYDESVTDHRPWKLEEPVVRKLVLAWQKAGESSRTKPWLTEYIERFPSNATVMRILLATILVREESRPDQGLEILADLEDARMPRKYWPVKAQLITEAHKLLDDGGLELDFPD